MIIIVTIIILLAYKFIIVWQHFLDNEEDDIISEDEVPKQVNSGSDYDSDEEPHWDSLPSNTSPGYTEPKSPPCTSSRSKNLKVNTLIVCC